MSKLKSSITIQSETSEFNSIWAETKIWCRRKELRPTRAHPEDSGLDLRADLQLRDGSTFDKLRVLFPGQRYGIPTGVHIAVPTGWEVQVRPRSGLALKSGITIVNSPGTIDSGYRGEILVILLNNGDSNFTIRDLDRIAQMVVCPVSLANPIFVDSLEDLGSTKRSDSGFGSTGI